MPVTLTVVRGPHTGRAFPFDRHETFLVGRSSSTHFALPDDPYFSRVHFLLEVNPPLCRLTDLNSHNGTLVNRQRVRVAELRDGDVIEAGRSAFKLDVGPDPDPPAGGAAPADTPAPAGDPGEELDRVMDEIEDRRDRGEHPSLAEYVRRYPHLAAALKVAFLAFEPREPVPAPVPPPPPPVARPVPRLPGYALHREVGRGGMGVVYLADRLTDNAPVAIKTITAGAAAGPVAVGRFLREAKLLQHLRHPHVVGGFDAGDHKGTLYIVM